MFFMFVCSASLLFTVVCVSDGTHEILGIDPPRGKILEMEIKKPPERIYSPLSSKVGTANIRGLRAF